MITNNSPLWLRAMADMEQEDPLFVRNHITSEFLEATCVPLSDYCDVCNRVDPFCPHLIAQYVPVSGVTTPSTGLQPWDTPIASPDPCPLCGHKPWWADQNAEYGQFDDPEDDEWDIDPQTGFSRR